MNILIETKGDPQLEIWSARRASDLFVDTFQREVLITAAITESPMIDSAAGVKATHLLN
jgi:hypothetical protein